MVRPAAGRQWLRVDNEVQGGGAGGPAAPVPLASARTTHSRVDDGMQDFGLHVPIDAIMTQLDNDASGTVDFKEFKALLE